MLHYRWSSGLQGHFVLLLNFFKSNISRKNKAMKRRAVFCNKWAYLNLLYGMTSNNMQLLTKSNKKARSKALCYFYVASSRLLWKCYRKFCNQINTRSFAKSCLLAGLATPLDWPLVMAGCAELLLLLLMLRSVATPFPWTRSVHTV